jgi:uncharacterized membrane protein
MFYNGRYSKINVPSSVWTVPNGIDDLGRVIGWYVARDDSFRGFLLDQGHFQDIGFPGAELEGTVALDIEILGTIVGGYIIDGIPHGFSLKDGVYRSIDAPGATGTRAFGVNPLGHTVGSVSFDEECSDCFSKGFLLTEKGFKFLEVPGAEETHARGINFSGQIVGFYYDALTETNHGFLLDSKSP